MKKREKIKKKDAKNYRKPKKLIKNKVKRKSLIYY
jgi:hypothetical protein